MERFELIGNFAESDGVEFLGALRELLPSVSTFLLDDLEECEELDSEFSSLSLDFPALL
jgi:hypothetical protein